MMNLKKIIIVAFLVFSIVGLGACSVASQTDNTETVTKSPILTPTPTFPEYIQEASGAEYFLEEYDAILEKRREEGNLLPLDKLIELSQKDDNLTLDDLAGYNCYNPYSGRLVRYYYMENGYCFYIGDMGDDDKVSEHCRFSHYDNENKSVYYVRGLDYIEEFVDFIESCS